MKTYEIRNSIRFWKEKQVVQIINLQMNTLENML